MKEIKEHVKNGKTPHVCELEDLILLRCPTTQSNLQSQCKPYQISIVFFIKIEKKQLHDSYGIMTDCKEPNQC